MAPKVVRWRSENGVQEVKTNSDGVAECIINVPVKIRLPWKCKPKVEKVALHIFNKTEMLWLNKDQKAERAFLRLEFDTNATVASVIEKVVSKARAGSIHPWAVTEVFEAGDGAWQKGTTILYASEKAAGNLASFGWTSDRGEGMPPVWLVVHKVK